MREDELKMLNAHSDFLQVDYAALVGEYEARLETVERGFRMEPEFLEAWVPDEDHSRSLYYLFEAAAATGVPGLSVSLNPQLFSSLDHRDLLHSLQALGSVELGRLEQCITVTFGESTDRRAILPDSALAPDLHEAYRERFLLESRLTTNRLPTPLPETVEGLRKQGLRVMECDFAGGTLVLAVEPTDHTVVVMGHAGVPDGVGGRLLDQFCRLLEGCPIQEIAEHGALRLENVLRDPATLPPVPGLITPAGAGPLFADLNNLARHLFRRYIDQYSVPLERNTCEQPVSLHWQALSQQLRNEAVVSTIAQLLARPRMQHVKVDVMRLTGTEIYVRISGSASESEKRQIVRAIEQDLKVAVEQRLEVYLEPAVDRLQRDQKSELMHRASASVVPSPRSVDGHDH